MKRALARCKAASALAGMCGMRPAACAGVLLRGREHPRCCFTAIAYYIPVPFSSFLRSVCLAALRHSSRYSDLRKSGPEVGCNT